MKKDHVVHYSMYELYIPMHMTSSLHSKKEKPTYKKISCIGLIKYFIADTENLVGLIKDVVKEVLVLAPDSYLNS